MIRAIAALAMVGACVGLGVVSAPKASADELGSWRAGGSATGPTVFMTRDLFTQRVVDVRHAGQRLRVALSLGQSATLVQAPEPEPQEGVVRIASNLTAVPLDALDVQVDVSTLGRSFRDPVLSGQVLVRGNTSELRIPITVRPVQLLSGRFELFTGSPPQAASAPVFSTTSSRGTGFRNSLIRGGETAFVRIELRTRAGRTIRVPIGPVEVLAPSTIRYFSIL